MPLTAPIEKFADGGERVICLAWGVGHFVQNVGDLLGCDIVERHSTKTRCEIVDKETFGSLGGALTILAVAMQFHEHINGLKEQGRLARARKIFP
ncbi:MAG: hypothetical protein IIB62_05710 [Proteobacteria bacterium]|nr:hypothetical protein [Pseudomonadota bacterium]